MKSFREYQDSAIKPVYVRKDDEVIYDLADDVFIPGISTKDTKESINARLKALRIAAMPKNWKGMKS
tara:strand:+ start:365 stop:565 length:201 start_codon:yes stop_codon:yes gene_type:complete